MKVIKECSRCHRLFFGDLEEKLCWSCKIEVKYSEEELKRQI